MTDPIVAYVLFTDGAKRPVYQEPSGKQYVIDDEGEKVSRSSPDAVENLQRKLKSLGAHEANRFIARTPHVAQ
jgi:hypothetical protein